MTTVPATASYNLHHDHHTARPINSTNVFPHNTLLAQQTGSARPYAWPIP